VGDFQEGLWKLVPTVVLDAQVGDSFGQGLEEDAIIDRRLKEIRKS
jgi:hypothetical protein